MAEEEPVRIVLTPEQREVVRRLSGQHVEAMIPRQAWVRDDEPPTGGPAE